MCILSASVWLDLWKAPLQAYPVSDVTTIYPQIKYKLFEMIR